MENAKAKGAVSVTLLALGGLAGVAIPQRRRFGLRTGRDGQTQNPH